MKIPTFCLIVILCFTCQPIHAESRTALVIENAEYKVGRLRNPVNDAKDISAALKKTGFDVMLLENANQRQMDDAVRVFGKKLKKGDTSFLHQTLITQSHHPKITLPILNNVLPKSKPLYTFAT